MRNTFNPDCWYDNKNIKVFENVHSPNEVCSGKLCMHKKTFKYLGRSDYQCPQCTSSCQLRNIPSEEQTNYFFLICNQGIDIFEETQKSIQHLIGDVCCFGMSCSRQARVMSLQGKTMVKVLRLYAMQSVLPRFE